MSEIGTSRQPSDELWESKRFISAARVTSAMHDAATAVARGDIEEARACWSLARTGQVPPLEAWLLPAEFALGNDQFANATALLQEATELFPKDVRPSEYLARAEERRGNWKAAELYWRSFIAIEPRKPWAHVALSRTIRAQGMEEAADKALADSIAKLPDDCEIVAEYARIAQTKGRWNEAAAMWQDLIVRFPKSWAGFHGMSETLAHSGRRDEADAFLDANAAKFPEDGGAIRDLAELAARQRDWPRAERSWRSFIALGFRFSWAYAALATALREQNKLPELEEVLVNATRRFPADRELAVEAARSSEAVPDWAIAAERWHRVTLHWLTSPTGLGGQANALRRQGLLGAADTVIQDAIQRMPAEPSLHEAYGLGAMAAENWVEARCRFLAAQERFPADAKFAQRAFEAGLRIAGSGGDATSLISRPNIPDPTDNLLPNRELVMAFESLGGGGHGCEFGIFQRDLGAEPLGLLRWADIDQDKLAQALENDFAGVGEPEFTRIFVPDPVDQREYWTTDTRYHMAMRCFVSVDDVPLDRMTQQIEKRLSFLRKKLINDLKTGEKIFVYKNMRRNISSDELMRLHAACRRYGDNTLLYVRYADSSHPSGSVIWECNGLLVGFVDHFSHAPDTDKYIGPANEALLQVCRLALSLWKNKGLRSAEM